MESRSSFSLNKVYNLREEQLVSLPREATIDLIEKSRNGDELATEKLITHNLLYVRKLARRHLKSRVEMEDLVQEGVFGIYKAIEKFEEERNLAFLTYGAYWIRQALQLATCKLDPQPVIIPIEMRRVMSTIYSFERLFIQRNFGKPSVDEIFEDVKDKYPFDTMDKSKTKKLWIKEAILLRGAMSRSTSLNSQPKGIQGEGEENDNSDLRLGYLATKVQDPDPFYSIERQNLNAVLKEALDNINTTERNKEIFVRRIGLKDGVRRTLDDVGGEFNITRERARQVEKKLFIMVHNYLEEHHPYLKEELYGRR